MLRVTKKERRERELLGEGRAKGELTYLGDIIQEQSGKSLGQGALKGSSNLGLLQPRAYLTYCQQI